MVKINQKLGFSLLEALVVMTIAAIFVAVIATVVPHKAKPKVSAEAHGGFECYRVGNQLYSRTITVGSEGHPVEVSGNCCTFRPNRYVPYLIFNAVGGGSAGGSDEGGTAGLYTSAFIPIPNSTYRLCPGDGGTVDDPNGKNTTVTSLGSTIVEVSGGNAVVRAQDTQFRDVLDVYVANQMPADVNYYGCNTSASAKKGSNNAILVDFCDTSSNRITKEIAFINSNCSSWDCYDTIMNTPVVGKDESHGGMLSRLKPGTKDIWEYYDVGEFKGTDLTGLPGTDKKYKCTYDKITSMTDPFCPSRFKLEIVLNIPDNGDEGAISNLTKYADMMNYEELKNANPGNGGAKGGNSGSPGAVLVVW